MGTKRPFFSTAVMAIIGRSGGFVIPFVIAALYGATPSTDAFFFSYGIVILLITIFSHIFESALIPYLAEIKEQGNRVSGLVNRVLVSSLPAACLVFIAVYFLLKPWLIHLSHWPEVNASLVAQFFLGMMPFFAVGICISACHSVLFTYRVFWISAVSPLVRSLTVMGILFLFHESGGVQAAVWGFVAGEILRGFWTVAVLKKTTPWKPVFADTQKTAGSKYFLDQAFFQGAALIAVNSLFLADQWFASQAGTGGLSLLNYADRVLQIPYLLMMNGFMQIFLTDWAESYHSEPPHHFWPKVHRDIRLVFIFSLSLGALLWIFRHPVIALIYYFGNLSQDEIRTIGDLFGWLSLGFIPGVVRVLCSRVLFVMRKSSLYCLQSWLEFGANIALNSFLIRSYGLVGIAMGTAIVYAVSTVLIYAYIRTRLHVKVTS